MDLFDYMKETTMEKESPLASRMRPTTLDEVVGQEHIIGPGKLLYRAIKADKLGSVIFYGPPGTGKTTLARVIANHTLVASVPELEGLIRLVAGNLVSFEKTGPMQVGLIVPSTISTTNLLRLTTAITTRRVDDEYAVPYPATLSISGYRFHPYGLLFVRQGQRPTLGFRKMGV